MTPLGYFDSYAASYQHYKAGAWCYEDGLVYQGLALLHQATGHKRFLDHLVRLTDRQIDADGALSGYRMDEFNIDHIMAGRCLPYLEDITGDVRYRKAADRLAEQLANHPRTAAGNYWHKQIYPHQVWLDGLYMGLPFQIDYGQRTGNLQLVDDALAQICTAMDLTATGHGLFVHGYDESREQRWADNTTGRSPACWGRALGWLAMALSDILSLSGANTAQTRNLLERTQAFFQRISELQGQEGRWLQVIDMPDLAGNYPESSASAMFAYAFLRAGRLGIWPQGTLPGMHALRKLYEKALVEDETGRDRFNGICHVAGLGGFSGVYRDGSPEYYLTEDVVCDDPKGVGPLMMAHAEALRCASAMDATAANSAAE